MSKKIARISRRHLRRLKRNVKNDRENYSTDTSLADEELSRDHETNEEVFVNIFSDNNPNSPEYKHGSFCNSLAQWGITHKISRSACDDLLLILRNENINVPMSMKTLLQGQSIPIEPSVVPPGKYHHIGLEKSLKRMKLSLSNSVESLYIDIGVDGLPLFKSSGRSLWPIMGAISNNNQVKPFLIGSYIGLKKPDNPNQYLKEFVNEVKEIKRNKLEIDGRLINLKIRLFICDAPARAFLTGAVGHTAANGCSKCVQKGRKIKNTLTYSTTAATPRTKESFKNRDDLLFHTKYFQDNPHCLEEELNIDMITQFPLDVMHLIDLGVCKKIIGYIWNNKHNRTKLSLTQKEQLNNKLLLMSPFIPKEFCRKPRIFQEFPRWKATEFRQLILYTSVVLFKDVIDNDLYEHIILLHGAYRLLLCPKNCQKNLSCVKEILETFVHNFSFLYGEHKISYNVHNLLHLADCVEIFGNVDSFSAYKFENFMQTIKKDCRQPTNILQQINNRLEERSRFGQRTLANIGLRSLSKKKVTQVTAMPIYCNYHFDTFYLSTQKPNNSCYVKPLIPIKITGFFKDADGEEYIIGQKFLNTRSYFTEPFDSTQTLGISLVSNLSATEEKFNIHDVACKVVSLPVNDGFVFLPILHHCISCNYYISPIKYNLRIFN